MSFAQQQVLQKYGFPCTLWAILGTHSIVVKFTATIFFSLQTTGKHLVYDISRLFVAAISK